MSNKLTGPALVTGLAAEARVARLTGWPVAIGGGTEAGAAQAAQRLIEAGATGLVSFGLAGGLDPGLLPGAVIVASAVEAGGKTWPADPCLSLRVGGMTGHVCLGVDRAVATADEKLRLGRTTGAALADMESGAVAAVAARSGIPFAMLRAICDPAWRDLPPAALKALDQEGRLAIGPLALSVVTGPGQIGALIALARDAAAARRALRAWAIRIGSDPSGGGRTGESGDNGPSG